MKDELSAAALGVFVGLLAGLILGVAVEVAGAKRRAVAHGCASWVADENGKAVFTWKDE